MKCECCKKNNATVKDFRETETGSEKFRVCTDCFNLTDEAFFKLMNKVIKTSSTKKMYLRHLSTVKENGVIEIEVAVINDEERKFKKYTYVLASQYAAEKFHSLYRRGKSCHGKALAILNKFKIKEK